MDQITDLFFNKLPMICSSFYVVGIVPKTIRLPGKNIDNLNGAVVYIPDKERQVHIKLYHKEDTGNITFHTVLTADPGNVMSETLTIDFLSENNRDFVNQFKVLSNYAPVCYLSGWDVEILSPIELSKTQIELLFYFTFCECYTQNIDDGHSYLYKAMKTGESWIWIPHLKVGYQLDNPDLL